MSEVKVAVVTGSNQGIGFHIVKNLCEHFPGLVYLTSRDETKGKEAVQNLRKLSLDPHYHRLDVLDKASISKFSKFLKSKHGGIDILVNNAAIAYQVDSPEPFRVQAETCLATNYFGLLHVCDVLFPLLRPHARVVNMSSCEGHLSKIPGQNIRERLSSPNLTVEGLTALVKEFIASAKAGTYNETGWGRCSYRVSKNAVNALTFIQQRAFDYDSRPDIVVNAVHPGFCYTKITRFRGIESPQQGAESPTYLALLPPNVTHPKGEFVWKDKTIISWVEPLRERF